MIERKPKEIKLKMFILLVAAYTFITNLDDVVKGFSDGWKATTFSVVK